MKFSVSLKQPLAQMQPPDWSALNTTIAQSSEHATWVTAYATIGGAVVAACALVAAIISAFYNWRALKISQKGLETSQKALETWRGQVLGEHEFGRLLDAIQTLYDIENTIKKMRSNLILQGESNEETRSQQFRGNLQQLTANFLRASVGLDVIWGESFKTARENLLQLIHEIAVASNYIYEKGNSRIPIPSQYALMGQNTEGAQPPLHLGVTDEEMINKATKRIENTISKVQLFLTEKLKAYVGINK
jgi:hypothetical protein